MVLSRRVCALIMATGVGADPCPSLSSEIAVDYTAAGNGDRSKFEPTAVPNVAQAG